MLSTREHPNVINVFFVLAPVWVEVERGGVSHVGAGFIRDDRDIIAYLALVRITFEWIKRIAHRHVRCPGNAGISAEGIK